MIIERSWTWRTAVRTASAIDAAVQASWSARAWRSIAGAIGQLSHATRLRCAIALAASAAVAYVAIESALPLEVKAAVPVAAVLLVLLCGVALALPFRQ